MSKIQALLFSSLLLLFVSTAFSGCDKCKQVECVNGACDDGRCICEAGFTGERCEKTLNESFADLYRVDERCTAGFDDYYVTINIQEGTNDKLILTGLWEQEDPLDATVQADSYTFVIDRQPLGTVEVRGEGYFTQPNVREEIVITYQVYQSGASSPFDECTATLDRR